MINKYKKDIKDFKKVAISFYGDHFAFLEAIGGYYCSDQAEEDFCDIYYSEYYYYHEDYYYEWVDCPIRIRSVAIMEILDLNITTIGDVFQHQIDAEKLF